MQGQRKELLLQMLAESTDFLSGEKLAGELGISRAAVWKMIASLRQEGYCIEAVKKRGYLLQETDVLSAQQIRRALAKPWREIPIQVYDCIDSTNTQAKRQLSAGWRGEAILTAQEQTAGRGRRGRDFYSPRDKGIYMSLILQPQLRIEESLLITSAAAVAVCRALEGELGEELGIKWVNDIYRGGKKVCGILTEAITDFELGVVQSVIVGIGINLRPQEFPADLTQAASLDAGEVSRNRVIAAVAGEVFSCMQTLREKAFLPEYRRRSILLGQEISFEQNGIVQPATAVDIDEEGGLLVRLPDGRERLLNSGEVTVRPCAVQ